MNIIKDTVHPNAHPMYSVYLIECFGVVYALAIILRGKLLFVLHTLIPGCHK